MDRETESEGGYSNTGLHYFSHDEISSIINRADKDRDKLLFMLLYELGCTLNELLGIRIRDIDLDQDSISISGKSMRIDRICHISRSASNLISSYLQRTGLIERRVSYLFETSHGGNMTPRRANQIIKGHLTKMGYPDRASPQVIKYSHIVNAYLKSVPLSSIRKQVGITKQRLLAIVDEIEVEDIKGSYKKFFEQ